ncbi:transcriptional regulator [Pigmentiphaga litoralis]|nr:transcriptional regulator [Pigmentiphaga litoralis]
MDMDVSPPRYTQFDRSALPVTAMATDFPNGHNTGHHRHPNAQLIHAVHGVMVVSTEQGLWVVPPTRAIWMPPDMPHQLRMVGEVKMRAAFIRPDASPHLPTQCSVIGISALLRELILAAIDVPLPYSPDTRDGRLMRLLLDELRLVPTLPLHLPHPTDPRLRLIGQTLTREPHDRTTAAEWAQRLGVDPKTIHRLFLREMGMTFGQWRQQARLLAALEMLACQAKIVDVALELGYGSPSAFATMFKRQFGVAPSAFFVETMAGQP